MAPTREKSLSEREFELLLEGAGRIDDPTQRLESRAAILIGGRLGLRPGETTHLSASWIDQERQMIRIPEHHACTKGRDGDLCGYCRQAIEQRVRHNPDNEFNDFADLYWLPKRKQPLERSHSIFSYRVRVAIDLLITEHSGWPYSFSTLQRRLNTALDLAPQLSRNDTSLHGLRATAASHHASRGLDLAALRAMFGWEDITTARQYLNVDGAMTRRALDNIH